MVRTGAGGGRRHRLTLAPPVAALARAVVVASLLGVAAAAAFPVRSTVAFRMAPAAPAGLRLHVVAASDDPADQALKEPVRDAVAGALAPWLAGARDVEEAARRVESHLAAVEEAARAALAAAGSTAGVRLEWARVPYPGQDYAGGWLPAGDYWALRVVIGEGGGKNLFCLLFPDLCRGWLGAGEPAEMRSLLAERLRQARVPPRLWPAWLRQGESRGGTTRR